MNKKQVGKINKLRKEANDRCIELETYAQTASVLCRETLMKMAAKYRYQAQEYEEQIRAIEM
jgi:hypothetical protein